MRFLTGKDYPELCDTCRHMVDTVVDLVVEGPDTNDEEAPISSVYDHHLFCGGDHCAMKEQPRLEARHQEWTETEAHLDHSTEIPVPEPRVVHFRVILRDVPSCVTLTQAKRCDR